MYCPNCGKPLKDDASFCGNCGARIKGPDKPDASASGGAGKDRKPGHGRGCGIAVLAVVLALVAIGILSGPDASDSSSSGSSGAPSMAATSAEESGDSSDYEAYEQTDAGLAKITQHHENGSGSIDAADVNAVLDEVKSYASSQEGVADVSRNDGCVVITYENGLRHAYIPPIEGIKAGGKDVSLETMEPFYSSSDGWANIMLKGSKEGESSFDSVASYAAGQLPNCSFSNNRDDSAVSLSALGSISANTVVVYNGHGGYDEEIGEFLATGETFDRSSYEKHRKDMDAGRIIVGSSGDGGGQAHLCVTSSFFDHRYKKGDLDSCVFYLGACHGLQDDRLASVLHEKGADLVVGYDNTVMAGYDSNMFGAIMGYGDLVGLTDLGSDGRYLTWGQSIANAKSKFGESSTDEMGVRATMRTYPSGAADGLRLCDDVPVKDDSEEGLRSMLQEATGGCTVNAFTRADYDSDGTYEAFAVINGTAYDEGQSYTDAELWYVSTTGASLLESGAYGYSDGSTDFVAEGSPYRLYVHNNYGARGDEPGCCRVYGVQDGTAMLMGPSTVLIGFAKGDGGVRFIGYTQDGAIELELDTVSFELEKVTTPTLPG